MRSFLIIVDKGTSYENGTYIRPAPVYLARTAIKFNLRNMTGVRRMGPIKLFEGL
jgi:hypothetical protein